MYTLKGFLEELEKKYDNKNKIRNLINITSNIIDKTDFSVLYDREKGIFSK